MLLFDSFNTVPSPTEMSFKSQSVRLNALYMFCHFNGQPPCCLMAASISPIKRLVSIKAQMMR